MAEIVEGYKTNGSTQQSQDPAIVPKDPWIDDLRRDLRREMIRELAMRRIRSAGRDYQPQVPSRKERMFEAFLVGVAVTLASSWLCSIVSRTEGRAQ